MAKREREIQIRVTEEEYETILQKAKENQMQVGPYIRRVAKNPVIEQVDYGFIEQHTREIGNVRTTINQLIWTIEFSNNYLPKEIDTIVKMMGHIFEAENQIILDICKRHSPKKARKKAK